MIASKTQQVCSDEEILELKQEKNIQNEKVDRGYVRKKNKMVSQSRENVYITSNEKKAESHSAIIEWIKNIRSKKIFKKRQSKGQDLRSIAILTNAYLEHQKALRQKQSERLERWLAIKNSMELDVEENSSKNNNENSENSIDCDFKKLEEEEIRQKELKALFKDQMDDIDNFMNNLNSIKTSLVR